MNNFILMLANYIGGLNRGQKRCRSNCPGSKIPRIWAVACKMDMSRWYSFYRLKLTFISGYFHKHGHHFDSHPSYKLLLSGGYAICLTLEIVGKPECEVLLNCGSPPKATNKGLDHCWTTDWTNWVHKVQHKCVTQKNHWDVYVLTLSLNSDVHHI